ncbi:hypothetical protein [Actinomadura physcomitrii]|uniref:hypothetical protein n=1 Tax=Actinomadura physcomitrii TaxID=2650748 RepID=UPI00124E3C19|nr:hypothetical protein [Actinomadura physcomitrii]
MGAGLSQQVVMLIAQNAAPKRDLGPASSGVFASRMLGTAAGMAVFGGIVASRFAEEIGRRVPAGKVPAFRDAVRPEVLGTLPGPVRHGVAEAFAQAFSEPLPRRAAAAGGRPGGGGAAAGRPPRSPRVTTSPRGRRR